MAWWIVGNDISISIKEPCFSWSKLNQVREAHWLHAFWKVLVAGKQSCVFSYFKCVLLLRVFWQLRILDSGKSSLAATVGIDSDFPYVKIVSSCHIYFDLIPLCLSRIFCCFKLFILFLSEKAKIKNLLISDITSSFFEFSVLIDLGWGDDWSSRKH